jgi:hypothetical protein
MSRLAGSAIGIAASLALAGFMPAWAQTQSDSPSVNPSRVQGADRKESGFAVMAHARFGGIAGNVDEDLGLDYQDLFHEGFGFDLGVEWLFPTGSDFLGPYVTLGWETFDGKSADDDAGATLEPDRLDLLSVMAGVKWKSSLKKWADEEEIFAVFHLGVGAATYGAVEGTLIASGVPASVDVFDATTVFAFVLGFAVKEDFGRLFIDLNVDFRFQQPPDSEELDFGSSTAMVLTLGIGLGLEF